MAAAAGDVSGKEREGLVLLLCFHPASHRRASACAVPGPVFFCQCRAASVLCFSDMRSYLFPQSTKNEQHGLVWCLFGTCTAEIMEVKLSQS